MIESFIEEGKPEGDGEDHGKSITDPCLGWRTRELIRDLAGMCKADDNYRSPILDASRIREPFSFHLTTQGCLIILWSALRKCCERGVYCGCVVLQQGKPLTIYPERVSISSITGQT